MASLLHKLGLGTVQFGQAYGVSNTRGQVSHLDAAAIEAGRDVRPLADGAAEIVVGADIDQPLADVLDHPLDRGQQLLLRGRAGEEGVVVGDAALALVVVPEDDRHWGNPVDDLGQLSEAWKKQIEHHFNHYKDLKKPGTTVVEGWGDAAAAWAIIEDCAKRFKA